MKTFKLDQYGDVVITDNKIELVHDNEMIVQTIKQVLNTNLGEWFTDEEEGIDFSVILTKNPNYDLIQDTINTAVQQVADILSIEIETDNFNFSLENRQLHIDFEINVGSTGESTSIQLEL